MRDTKVPRIGELYMLVLQLWKRLSLWLAAWLWSIAEMLDQPCWWVISQASVFWICSNRGRSADEHGICVVHMTADHWASDQCRSSWRHLESIHALKLPNFFRQYLFNKYKIKFMKRSLHNFAENWILYNFSLNIFFNNLHGYHTILSSWRVAAICYLENNLVGRGSIAKINLILSSNMEK